MRLPDRRYKESGKPRRAGFEFEFAGIELREACAAVAAVLGGTVHKENPFAYTVQRTDYGDAGVELDAVLLKERRYLNALSELGVKVDPGLLNSVEDMLLEISSTLVPCEVVLPPIPFVELDIVEDVREQLRLRRAKGTHASLMYAFGLHSNVEPPNLSVGTLTAYLQAFILLHDHIRKMSEVDLTRAVSPFIDRYPAEYSRLVADPAYRPPSLKALIVDYLRFNPTRNRPLDMLPLFAHLEQETVMVRVPASEARLVKARPAFHYRLSNCRIDEPSWTVGSEWEQWLLVEALANDPDQLAAMGQDFLSMPKFPMQLFSESWVKRTQRWLNG